VKAASKFILPVLFYSYIAMVACPSSYPLECRLAYHNIAYCTISTLTHESEQEIELAKKTQSSYIAPQDPEMSSIPDGTLNQASAHLPFLEMHSSLVFIKTVFLLL